MPRSGGHPSIGSRNGGISHDLGDAALNTILAINPRCPQPYPVPEPAESIAMLLAASLDAKPLLEAH